MITLNDKYKIEPENMNGWKLIFTDKRKNKKDELVEYVDIWYYASIKDCLTKFLDNCLSDCSSAQEILNKIGQCEKEIAKVPNVISSGGKLKLL